MTDTTTPPIEHKGYRFASITKQTIKKLEEQRKRFDCGVCSMSGQVNADLTSTSDNGLPRFIL